MQSNTTATATWSSASKILFRFFAAYIITYIFMGTVMESAETIFDPLVNWTAKRILHIGYPITIKPNGSGDTTYNYVQQFLYLAWSVMACGIWWVVDRKRPSYTRALYWLLVLVRYYLAMVLLVYGLSKLFKSQFSDPSLLRLIEPYGKSSPMGLAWTFFGYSTAFNIFMGFFEAIGGVLMLFRRTTLFGACISATVLTNIVLINFCYDVPVKLFSSHLLLFTFFILFCNGKRFIDFFFLNKATLPAGHTTVFKNRKWQVARVALKSLLIIVVSAFCGYEVWTETVDDAADDKAQTPLYGIYNVATFVRNKELIPPLLSDSTRWSKLVVAYKGAAALYKMTDSMSWNKCLVDTVAKTVFIDSSKKSAEQYRLSYTKDGNDRLILKGTAINMRNSVRVSDSLLITMQRITEKDFLLTNRGFHWINEYPMNW